MTFITDILTGILIGFCYDFLKHLRKEAHRKQGVVALCDILFWLIAGTLILSVLFFTSDIEIRFYEFLGMFLGFFLYFVAFSVFLQPIHKKILEILQFFSKILFTIGKFFVIMIKNGFVFLVRPVLFVVRILKGFFQKQGQNWKRNLKFIKRI